MKVCMNGQLVDASEAKVSVFDHGLLYGDGIFEGIRVYNGKIFKRDVHMKRLFESARSICLRIPQDRDALIADLEKTVAANNLTDGYIRLLVTRGPGTLGLGPEGCDDPQIFIIAAELKLYPKEYYEEGLDIITASTIRNHPAALSPRIKSLNYLNNIMAKIEAVRAGCIEALMLNHKGEVSECTADNVFIVRDGELYTPPIDAGILDGITRRTVIELAGEMGITTHQIPLTKHDVYIADECFVTGTAARVCPVVKVDSRPIGNGKPGPMTGRLLDAYIKLVNA
ncbi:MAG: branched-chain-amino-acid transaminase [Planctomycetota bacterium]